MTMPSSDVVADKQRQLFYDEILKVAASRPTEDSARLGRAWLQATGAAWIWLWLRNQYTGQWEIRDVFVRDDLDRGEYLPERLTFPADESVAAYCVARRQPEFVTDLEGWNQTYEGREYRVVCHARLTAMGCRSFLTVPFFAPEAPTRQVVTELGGSDRALVPIEGVVCCHFDRPTLPFEHPPFSLWLMARLTAQLIVNSYHAMQREILVELNAIAESYLTRVDRRPIKTRREYLDRVIALIQKYLNVSGVSIFYHDKYDTEVSCIATTGIARRTDHDPIHDEQLSNVTYKAGEGLTGKCFQTGEPDVLSEKEAIDHIPRFVEVLNGKPLLAGVVLYPLPCPREPHEDSAATGLAGAPKARGVIRCAGHTPHLGSHQPQPFDPVDLQTLAFIARQVAPIIETLTVRIVREQTISVIKHDLYAPLSMIRDTAEEVTSVAMGERQIRIQYIDLMNLKTAAMVAGNLVSQLDPDPAEVRDFSPVRTLLEGDVVARIRHMLAHLAKRENDMEISFFGFREIPPLFVDRVLVERVFVNLLMNAIKYGNAGSPIRVKAFETPDFFQVDIENQGIGILAEDMERIFDANYRSRLARQRRHGLGLGLYIARQAMIRHNGRLDLSNLANPTTFSIKFPRDLRFTIPK